MTFYERYLNGETKEVYDDIHKLGEKAFLTENIIDIEKVLIETFERVSYNLNVIYKELTDINYLFKTSFKFNSDCPLVKPLSNTNQLLDKLENLVEPFGYVPESLKMFYKIVGACNFGWDYDTNYNFIWDCADPIEIISLDDLVSQVANADNLEFLEDSYNEDGFTSLDLSRDYFHKDDISGGPSYSLQITPNKSIDAPFLYEENDTYFINYLRICFENCGFSRITKPEYKNDYKVFFEKVKPQLKKI
ncbi:hypothetical protein [Flavobacterium sp.]|uniref:hypothetical protein n=1 Tax=Flavobacterium sp. TaxID=239 RepID=UPI002EDAABAE